MIDALHLEFMRNALMAGLLASLICGILGTLVVINRIVFLAGGIAHAAYGGIGLAFFLGWPYLGGTLVFSLAAAMAMAAVSLRAKHRADTIIGVMWALGMAMGVILLDLTPGYSADLMSYLFGSILAVASWELWLLAAAALVVTVVVARYYNGLVLMSYDEEFARVRGVPVTPLYFLIIGMLAVALVLIIRMVGLLLVIALLTIAPFVMERHARSMAQMMAGAVLLNVFFTIAGLLLAYRLDITAGASIIMVGALCFFLELVLGRFVRKKAPAAGKLPPDG